MEHMQRAILLSRLFYILFNICPQIIQIYFLYKIYRLVKKDWFLMKVPWISFKKFRDFFVGIIFKADLYINVNIFDIINRGSDFIEN